MRFSVSYTGNLKKIKICILQGGVESVTFCVVASLSQVLYYLMPSVKET